jgi:hypothetical protein
MSVRNPTVVVTSDETLPDVVDRVRGAASGGRTVNLVVPIDSGLLLTAKEFRALKDAIDDERLSVVMRTSDPLRLHLGERLGIEAKALPRPKAKAVATVPTPVPPIPLDRPSPEVDSEEGISGAPSPFARPDPAIHWPNGNGAGDSHSAEAANGDPETEIEKVRAPGNPPRRWLPVAALLVAIVVAAFFAIRFAVPRAVVRVVPKSVPVEATLLFDVTNDGQVIDDTAAFALKPQSRELPVTWEGSAPVTGVRLEPDGTATGPIELSNATAEPVTVDAGTKVATETGVEYAFVDAVTVPAMDAATGKPGAATGRVQAVKGGSGGNVGTGEIGGQLPNGVYYSNRMEATAGGTDKEFPIVAQADLDALSAQAKGAASDLAAKAIAADDQGREGILPNADVTKQEDRFDHQVNEDAESVSLRSVMTVQVSLYDLSAAEQEYKQTLAAHLAGAAPTGFAVDPAQIVFAAAALSASDERGTRLEVVAKGDAVAELTDDERRALAVKLAGKSADEAAAILAASPELAGFEVEYQPGWLPKQMPTNADRIQFELAQ